MRECPSSPGLRTLHFHCQGSKVWVQSLIKKKKKKKKKGWSTGGEVRMTIEYSRLKGCGSAERPHCVGDCRRAEGEEIGLGQHTDFGVGRSRASAEDRK